MTTRKGVGLHEGVERQEGIGEDGSGEDGSGEDGLGEDGAAEDSTGEGCVEGCVGEDGVETGTDDKAAKGEKCGFERCERDFEGDCTEESTELEEDGISN